MTSPPPASVPSGAAVPSLVRWGLSSDADLVFRTLVTFGPRLERELSTALGLPRQRIVNALAELHAAGAAIRLSGGGASAKAALWQGRSPADVVHALRTRRLRWVDREAQAQQHRGLVRVLSMLPEGSTVPVLPTPVGGTKGEGVRYLRTRALLRARLAELTPRERHEHLTINTEQIIEPASLQAGAPLAQATAARGLVHTRVLSPPPPDGDAFDPVGDLVNDTTYQYRESLDTPLKLFVIDRRIALFPVDPLDFEHGYLEVSQPSLVAALVRLFERHWAAAVDPKRHAVPAIVLSPRERDLIVLLALGHTDATAAAHLRISARTVTNALRALMDRLGVENRFQLGLALGALDVAVPPSLDEITPTLLRTA